MQTISTPDGQVYQFPDTMSREQMAAAIQARLAKRQTGSASGDLRAGMLQAQMVIPGVRANKHLDIIQNAQTGNLSQGNFAQNAQYLLDLAKSYEADLNLLEDPDERATLADQIADLRNQAANIQSTAATPTAQNTQASLDAAAGRSAQTLATDVLPNLMDLQRRTSQIPMSAKAQEMFNPEGDTFLQQTGDVFDTFREAPGEITRTVFLRSLPAMIPTVAAAIAGTAVGGPAAGGTLAGLVGGSTELGIALSQELTQELGSRGVNVEDPNAVKAWAEANPELITDMLMNARKRALAIGTVDAATGLVTGRIARAANQGGKLRKGAGVIAGGTVGAVGEGLGESAALQAEGKEQNPGEIAGEMLGAGPMIAGQTAGQMAVQKSRNLYTSDGTLADPTTLEESYRGAAGDVARQLKEIATVNNYNLKDIGTGSNGARQALEDIRSSNVSRINLLRNSLKRQLDPKNAENLEDLVLLYAEAQAGIAAGKKKVSQKVISQQFDAIKQLVGPYKEGAQLLNELQKSNVITDLFKDGVKGGISQFTDYLSPFSQSGAVYDPSRMANVATGLILPAATGGSSIKVQAGGFALGRMIDAATGRRSRVARFVNKNLNSFGLPDPEGPSLVEQKALNEAQSKDRRLAIAEVATALNAPKPGPLESMTLGTGLDRAGLETVVNKMAQDFANSPEFTPVLEDISKNLAGEGNRIDALTEIIPVIGAYAQQNTPELLVAPPDNQGLLRDFNMIAPERLTGMQTAAPQQPTQDPQQSGRQFTSPENYQAGIDANIELAETLQSTLSADPDVSVTDKGQLLSVLEGLKQPLTNPTVQLQTDIEALQRNDVSSEAIDKYVRPYLDRVTNQREQRSRLQQRVQDDRDLEVDQSSPARPALAEQVTAPVFVQSASLSAGVPEVYGQVKAEGNKDGFMPHLRVEAPAEREGKPLFTVKSNNKNSPRQIEAIDEVLERHPDPASSPEAWANMFGDALASKDIPVQPHQFIKDINEGGAQALLSKLTPGQIADADHGFANAKEFRRAYTNGEIRIEDTGRLFLWSFLSRGVSPYTQEGLFLDSFDGIEEWIRAAAGTSNKGPLKSRLKEYKKWASTTAPKGSGQPGSGAMHNLNAFGETFLLKMSEDAGLGDGRSRLQVIHDMMSDPNTTGKEVRRQFLRMGEGVGIDNKVVSFTLLVAGYDDVMVLDRVQMRQMWNDGRFDGLNLYDGYKSDGKPVTGSALSQLTYGARGLLVYEALEKSLQSRLNQIYTDVGRPDAASVGRYHWETWVASSEQEASHATIDAILARAQGDPNPLDGVMAKEGEYGAYAYGAKYGIIDGEPGFIYNVPNAGDFKFTVPQFKSFLEDIKKAKNKVVPSNFKVTQSGNAPWYTREEVNLDALAERAKKYGKQVRPTDEELRQGQELPDGRTSDAPDPRAGQTADDREAPALSDFIRNGPSQLRRALSRRVPSKQEVVGQFPAVKALFEIGKKGSPYENGITNIEDALMLAKALGITVHMFNDHQKMLETLGADSQTLRGRFRKTSNGASGTVFALEPGTDYRGRNLTDIEALTTLLHEIFHGVTMGPMSGVGPMLNGNGNGTPSVENAIGAMIDKPQGKRTPQERKILREITRLQNSLSAYVEGKPTERRPVRGLIAAMDSFDQQRNQMTPEEQMDFEDKLDAHVKYIRSKAEFSVDPFWVYAVNPKMAKLVMPETTKWIQGELRKAGNKDIQFFTHPLAISIAVVMALMASEQAEDEQREEQQRQQMQPGALSPTAGMLSAA